MINHYNMQLLCQTFGKTKKIFFLFLLFLTAFQAKAHNVNYYTPSCNAGPSYSVQPDVTYVNNSSNYAWQYKNASNVWVCINNGNNVINGNTYNVSGATYTATQFPGPIVFTNPNIGLQGLEIRCLISDNANPCNMPAGNTWTSATNHFINVSGTPCSCNNVTDAGSIGYDETFCGASFDPANIVSVTLPSGGAGALEYVWLISYDGGASYSVIAGATGSSYDPGVINQTTWYRRCSRRVGCSDFVGESNWIMKSLCPIPTANAGPDKNLTCNVTSATIGTAAVAGLTYSWSPATGLSSTTIAQPIASPASTLTYTVTVTNSCGCTATDAVIVNVNTAPPTANAGPDKNLNCSITSATIGTAAIAGNTYSWSPAAGLSATNIAQPVASPNTTTTYTVTVTGANGCVSTDAVIVNVNTAAPTADAGPDKNLNCSTTSSTIGTVALAGNTYSWSPATGLSATNIAQPVASPNTTTTYTVTVTGANGCVSTDAVIVNVNTAPPTANAGPDKNLNCSTTSSTIGTVALAGNTYSWSPATGLSATNIAQPVASPVATITYTVTVTGANGCTATDVVTVNVNTTPPTADAGPDKNLNCSITSATIGTAAIAGNTYSWSPAAGLSATNIAQPVASPNTTTTYTVTVTGANGCVSTDAVIVNVNTAAPTVDAGPDRNLDCSVTSATIGTAAIANYDYSWSPAIGLNATNIAMPTASPAVTTIYTVTVTGPNGCTASDVVIVNVNTTPPTVDAGPDRNLDCATTSTVIGTAGLAGNTYSWSPAIGLNASNIAQPTASPLTTTSYTVTVGGLNGCTATDVVVVEVNTTPPFADAGPDRLIDCSTTSAIIGTAALPGNTYSWSPASGLSATNVAQPTATPNVTTAYTVTVTGANGCTSTDVVVVTVNVGLPVADAGPDQMIDCHILSVQLGTVSVPGLTYSWSPAAGLNDSTLAQPIANPAVATTYTLTVTGLNGCSAADVVVVGINQTPPTAVITGILEVCNGSTTTITASTNGAGTFLWNTGANTASITVGEGTYTVTVTDGVCTNTASATVQRTEGNIGNYVWYDTNLDGIQNEPAASGINGVTVELWNAGLDLAANTQDDILLQTTTTANDINNNPGYYNFIVCNNGNYFVKFPSSVNEKVTTVANPAAGVDFNSDINNAGFSPVFNIDVHGVGVAKNNNTIDAGYIDLKYIGNFVWFDRNRNGIQDGEAGVAGITVTLLDNNSSPIASTVTDAYGYYLFNNVYSNTYRVAFTLPPGFVFTTQNQGGNDEYDSDVDPITGITEPFNYVTGTIDLTRDAGIYLPTSLKAEIGDRVWNDVNKDGVQNPGETGIAGVTVTLYNNGIPMAYTITDAEGFYLFQAVTPGDYSVGFSLPIGYIFTGKELGGVSATDSDPDQITGRTDVFTVTAGEKNYTIDAGMYPQPPGLEPAASLGNFVWNDVNNNGLQDPNEAGIQGVVVKLYDSTGNNLVATTITDILGYYIFNNLIPGTYTVEFSNLPNGFQFVPNLVGAERELDSDPDPNTGRSNPVTLLGGEYNTTIDAGLHNANLPIAALGNFVWYDRNTDGVQNPGENGAAGITVQLFSDANTLLGTTITNNNGFYIFNNLNAGNYYVKFSNFPNGYKLTTQAAGADHALDSDPEITTGTTPMISLLANEVNLDIDAGLAPNDNRVTKGSIGDKVWNDTDADGIQDPGELGVQGVSVTLYMPNGITVISSTSTDALGNYMFTDLDQGAYVIGFSNLPIGYTFSPAKQGGDIELDGDADAASGGKTDSILLDEGDIILTIDAGIHQAAGLAGLGDRVWNDIDNNGLQNVGEPGIPGVTVRLKDQTGQIVANTTTDVNGIYQFTGLTPGVYSVQFSNLPAGYQFTNANMGGNSQESLDSDADPVNGQTNTVTLNAGDYYADLDAGIYTLKSSLGNYVWEDVNINGIQDANEKGLSGIVVTLYNAIDQVVAYAVTNSAGGYNFVNLEPGSYTVEFSNIPQAGIFSPKKQLADTTVDSDVNPATGMTDAVNLSPGEYNPTIDAGIHLPTGAGLGNYVWLDLDKDGIQDAAEPGVPGVTVTLYNEFNIAIMSTITTQAGAYTFNDLIPGKYSVGFTTLPTYYQQNGNPFASYFTALRAGTDSTADSDVDSVSGKTAQYTIALGEYNPTVDAGIVLAFPLPASSLTAAASLTDNSTVKVSWTTMSEMNTSIFEIQRSLDGKNFAKIGTTNASGITHGLTNYSMPDDISNLGKPDVIYYRVKLIDIDGKYGYSNVVNVKVVETTTEVTVFPSPFSNYVNILYNAETEGQIEVKITDLNGKVIAVKLADVTVGRNSVTIDQLESLATGMYAITIHDLETNIKTYFKVTKQ